jgi:O-antigen/teichoic acid export membrane protein
VFISNLTKLFSGNVIAQIIAIISIPIITRLYSVEDYGIYAVLLALVVILSAVSSLGMHLAILIPKKINEARKLLSMSFVIILFFCMMLMAVLLIYKQEIVELMGISKIGNMIYLIPFMVLLQSLYLIFTYWGVRKRQFGKVGISKILEGFFDRFSAIMAAMTWHSSVAFLVFSRIFSHVTSLSYLLKSFSSEKSRENVRINYRLLLLKYKNFLLYNTPSILLINGSVQLPIILFAGLYSPISAGLYAIAYRIVHIPVSSLADAVSKVYTQHIASKSHSEFITIKKDTDRMFKLLFSLALIPFTWLFVIGDSLLYIVLGDEWKDAGVYAQYLSFLAMSNMLIQSFGGIFDVMNQQKVRLIFHIVKFLLTIGAILLLSSLNMGIKNVIVIFICIAIALNLFILQVMFSYVQNERILLTEFLSNIIYVLIFLGVSFIIANIANTESMRLILVSMLSIVWLLSLYIRNDDIKPFVHKIFNLSD